MGMHITLCMLRLHSHAQIAEMKEALQEAGAKIAASAEFVRPLSMHFQGLHIMNDDPSNVGVMFTTDRSSALTHRMNTVAEVIFTILKARGLVSTQSLNAQRLLTSDGSSAEVKLHATLMNTKYSKSNWQQAG